MTEANPNTDQDASLSVAFDESLVLDDQNKGFRGPLYKRSFSAARGDFGDAILKLYGLEPNGPDGIQPNGSAAVCFPSGMAAIGAASSSLLKPGGVLVHGDELYTDVSRSFQYLCQQRPGTKAVAVDVRNTDALVRVFQEHGALIHVFHYEACTNPSGQFPDFSVFAKLKELAPNCTFVCDNTWLTAVLFNPFQHGGADLVLESCTKYLSGGRCIGGMVCGSSAHMEPVMEWGRVFGQFVPDTVAQLFTRQLATVQDRVLRASQNAALVAQALETDAELSSCVDRVLYPGLASHPTHNRAKTYLGDANGGHYPGCLLFHVPKGKSRTQKKLSKLRHIEFKTSFGGPKSRFNPWVEAGAAHQYDWVSPESAASKKAAATGAWIRLSLGFDEDVDDVLRKLKLDLPDLVG